MTHLNKHCVVPSLRLQRKDHVTLLSLWGCRQQIGIKARQDVWPNLPNIALNFILQVPLSYNWFKLLQTILVIRNKLRQAREQITFRTGWNAL